MPIKNRDPVSSQAALSSFALRSPRAYIGAGIASSKMKRAASPAYGRMNTPRDFAPDRETPRHLRRGLRAGQSASNASAKRHRNPASRSWTLRSYPRRITSRQPIAIIAGRANRRRRM